MTESAKSAPLTRLTAELDGDFVVFLIGFRINKLLNVSSWLPVAMAMPGMLRELERQPELGYLGGQFHGLTSIQYWRSVEHLNAYATNRNQSHLPAWRAFNRNARNAEGAVGVWHETYLVSAGQYENIFVNMPKFGIGRVGRLMPASGTRNSARSRLQRDS